MIEVQKLHNLDLEQAIDLLLEEKTQPFEIYIPKETQQFFSEPEAIFIDYANLAFSGQLLFDVSDEFEFEQVPPNEHKSVLFTIKARDFERLAATLLTISYGYGNENPYDEEFDFTELSLNYLYEIEQGKFSSVACPYFVDVCKDFQTADKDEN